MTRIGLLKQLLVLFIIVGTTGCIKVKDLTADEIKWFKPYNKTDTVIFVSNNNEIDTIIFHKKVLKSDTIRNIGQGFYNENYLTVPYKLTPGSYHQFAFMSDGKTRFDQNILSLSKSSDGYTSLEIMFLGTIFNGKELDNIKQKTVNIYYFDSSKATYFSINEEKGKAIKNFTFDINLGVIKYVDERNIKWERK